MGARWRQGRTWPDVFSPPICSPVAALIGSALGDYLSTSEPVMGGALAAPAVGAARAAARADRTPAGEVLLLVWCRGSGKQRARCCCPAVVPSRWLKLFPVADVDDTGHEKVLKF